MMNKITDKKTIFVALLAGAMTEPTTLRFDRVTFYDGTGDVVIIEHASSGPSNKEVTTFNKNNVLWSSFFDEAPLPVAAQGNL